MNKKILEAVDKLTLVDLQAALGVATAAHYHLINREVTQGGRMLACFGQLIDRQIGQTQIPKLKFTVEYMADRVAKLTTPAADEPVMADEVPYVVRPALCLDLDQTIRRSKLDPKGFIQGPDDIELVPGIKELIEQYQANNYIIAVISNQGGVAFGHKTFADIDEEWQATAALFEKNPFHIIRMCYNQEGGTVAPYGYRSLLRKPQIGMLAMVEDYAERQNVIVDWNKSLFVGDRPEDEACARNASIPYLHINQFLKTNGLDNPPVV